MPATQLAQALSESPTLQALTSCGGDILVMVSPSMIGVAAWDIVEEIVTFPDLDDDDPDDDPDDESIIIRHDRYAHVNDLDTVGDILQRWGYRDAKWIGMGA